MIEQKEAWQIRYVYFLSLSSCVLSQHYNDCTELRALLMLMFVRTVNCLRVSINQYLQYFWALLHNFLFMRWSVLLEPLLLTCGVFVYCLKKEAFLIHITVKIKMC